MVSSSPKQPAVHDRVRLSGRALLCLALQFSLFAVIVSAQNATPNSPAAKKDSQINVNWFYGSYVPREVPLESLNADQRFKLYIRQTYTTWGIDIKTTVFALRDQAHNTYPEWGDGFGGFAKRLGTRQAEFIIQNSVISLGNGLLGWEPRYDRCRCDGFGRAHATPLSETSSPTTAPKNRCGLNYFLTSVPLPEALRPRLGSRAIPIGKCRAIRP